MFKRAILCTLFASSLSSAVLAQDVSVYRPGQHVDPAAVAAILGGPLQRPTGIRTRGLQMLDAAPASTPAGSQLMALNAPSGAATVSSVTGRPAPTSLSLPVQFGFDSATIFPEAREQLDAVAEGIKMIPTDRPVVIEGHTDAVGTPAYNLGLSKRRALAVKAYLVAAHGIDASRLRAVGQGELAPIDPADPFGPVNRRVQFRGGE
ncbi:MAG: OmpA family protein [Lautropia sp.]